MSEARTALVTGASSGIGREIVAQLIMQDYRVMAAGRDAARLATLREEFPGLETWSGDLCHSSACTELLSVCTARLGRLDLLVNNAGIYEPATAEHTCDTSWQRTLDINLSAPFYLSRAALPELRKTRGVILNIASDWGLVGGQQAVAYCASKGGIVLMTKAMALDHASEGVRVNAICPGDVDTPMLEAEGARYGLDREAALGKFGADSPTGRVTTANEVAALVLFLASDAARQITGAAIPIDGGNTAR